MSTYVISYCPACKFERASKPRPIDESILDWRMPTCGECEVCGAFLEVRTVDDEELSKIRLLGPTGRTKEEVREHIAREGGL